jgi:hypothetical protein
MGKLATMTLTGKSRRTYSFNVYPRTDRFAAVGAVYFMTVRTVGANGNGTHSWVYVGETGDLSDRPLNHERKPCFDQRGANCLLIHAEENPDIRLSIETDLRLAYNPPCNRQ